MPKEHGKDWNLKIDIAATKTTVGGTMGVTLESNRDMVATYSRDDGLYKTFIPGPIEWSISVELFIISDDAAYAEMLTHFHASNPSELIAQIIRKDGLIFEGNCHLQSMSDSIPHEDAVKGSFKFQGDGTPTKIWAA